MLFAILETAKTIARGAGALVLDYAARGQNRVSTKTSAVNLVTEADKAVEAHITAAIQAAYPDHHIHGEEGGGYGPDVAAAPFSWYVDPIDGTTNFAHGYPVYVVNLSVADGSGEPVVGVTYDPNRDECFSAVKGHGAHLNGRPIHVSRTAELRDALLVTGFPYDRSTALDNNMQAWSAFLQRTHALRWAGSAAMDMAYVACGRMDGYWERGPERWDFMAGILMVREAGGSVTTYTGETEGLYDSHRILASNGLIHQAMVNVLTEVQEMLAASDS